MRAFGFTVIVACLGFLAILADGVYVVDEGNAAVITKWSKAVGQEGPEGLKFKVPIITGVREFDVRERRSEVAISAATANRLPVTANISVNWRTDAARVQEVYVNYGTPEQFATNILAPRLQQAAKAGISQYQADSLIRDRQQAAETIRVALSTAMEAYPAIIASLQIENVDFPPAYLESVMKKEQAREDAERERYNLEKQALSAQQEVQTAVAGRDAAIATATGEAEAIRLRAKAESEATIMRGQAEAEALRSIENALKGNPLLVEYEQAKRWDGVLPRTVLGEDSSFLISLPQE